MSSADFINLVIRNTTSYNPDGSYVPSGQVFTVGEKGKQDWTNNLGLNQILVSTVSAASTVTSYSSNANILSVSSIGYVSSLQSNTILTTSSIICSTVTSYNFSVSTLSSNIFTGTYGHFASTLTSYMNIYNYLNVDGIALISGNVDVGQNMNVAGITNLSTLYCTSASVNGSLTLQSLFISSIISSGSIVVKSNASIGSTLTVSSISTSNASINIANITSSLYVGSALYVPYAQISTTTTSTLNIGNVLSSLNVYSTMNTPSATITTISGSLLSTQNASVLSTLTVGSTISISYGTYSTLIGSTISAALVNIVSSLTVGLSISAPIAQLSSITNSTLTTNVVSITSSLSVGSTLTTPSIQMSSLVGSAITTTTAYILSSLTIGSTFVAPSVQISTVLGSNLTTTFGVILSTLTVGSTLTTPSIQLSTLLGYVITTTNANVLSLITAPAIQLSSLSGSTITANNVLINSTLTIGSTFIVPMFSTSSFNVSSVTTNTILATSSLTASSVNTSYVTTTKLVVSTITDLQGSPFSATFGKSGMVCSNMPLTFNNMSVLIDRVTKKIAFLNTASISTLYKTEFYAYNGSSWVQGYDVPPSSTPISLSTLKFPVAAYNLSTVGAWCSMLITDMTNFTGTWSVNAECVRAGANGDDLYSLELVQTINAISLTTVPSPPTSVVTALYPAGNPYGISYTFVPPAVTGGYISGYEAFATSDAGATYYTQIGFSSPLVVSGLTPGTTYTLTVKAKNAKGQSVAASGTPTTMIYKTLPDPPTAISGALYPAGAATGINVAFTYPVNTGGGVELYYASALDIASTQTTVTVTNPSTAIYLSSGLVPGTTYRFTVYSQNAGGTSQASTSVGTLLYQIPPPTAPTITSLALTPAGNPTGVVIGFAAPVNTGGGITDYITNLYTNGTGTGTSASTIGTTTPITVNTGLIAGSTFSFRVAGRNTGGTGILSAYSSIVYKTLPTAPTLTGLSLFPPGNPIGIQVLLTPPTNLGGGVDTYTASAYNASTFTASAVSTTSTIIVSSLTAGVFYTFNTVATNAGGTSVISNTSTTQYKTKPDPPTNVTGALFPVGAATGINVSFVYPINTGGVVDQYFASAMDIASTASTVTAQLSTSPIYLTAGLVAGTTYKLAVYSQNTGGTSITSTSATNLLFQTVPGAPTGTTTLLTPVGNPTGITVGFTAPANTGGGINSYTAIAYSSVVAIASTTGASSPLVVQTLTPGTAYNFVVTATNTAGTGMGSASSLITYKTLPSVPTNVSGALYPANYPTGINISFMYPSDLGGGVDTYYAMAIDTVTSASTVLSTTTASTVFIPSTAGLVAGTIYKFAVFAKNAGGSTASTLSASNLLFQTIPGAPTSVGTTLYPVGNPSGVLVNYTASTNTGGGISSFTAVAYSGVTIVASTIYYGSSPSSIFVNTLLPGISYGFNVFATNTAGNSALSPSSLITYKTLPSVPTSVSGALYPAGAATGINVSFNYPTDLGGGVDTYYALAYDFAKTASTVLVTTTASTVYIPSTAGLVAGTTYQFGVYAKNAGGSTASTLSGSILLFQIPPTAPLSLTTTLTPAGNPYGITASFLAPTNTGGGISYYTVSAYNGTTFVNSRQGGVLSYLFSTPTTSLVPGTTYNFYANAVNTGGVGASSITSAIVYKTLPDPPTNVVGALFPVGAGTGINITFSYPTNLGGGVDLYYAMAIDALTSASTVLSTSATSPIFINTAMGLVPGTTYKFAVFSKNAGGSSASTLSVSNLLYQTLPTAPTAVSAALDPANNPTGVNVSFTAPTNTFGGITNYRAIAYTGTTAITSSIDTTSPIKVSTLTAGTSYNYTVAAVNDAGIGVSSVYTTLVYYTQPGLVTGVSFALQPAATPTGVNVSFTPGATGGGALTYTARAYTGTTVTSFGTNTASPVYITSLTPGTSYNFTVTAANVAVTGLSTTSAAYTYYTNPSAPQSITTTVGYSIGSQKAYISWTAPATNGGSAITGYTITSNPAAYSNTVGSGTTNVTTTAVLTNGSAYTFTVVATNGASLTSSATSGSVTPYGLAGQTTGLSATALTTVGQIYLSWSAASANGKTITNYRVSQTGGSSNTYTLGNVLSYTVTGLASQTSYTFTVAATNDGSNYGTSSNSASASTVTVPTAPQNVSASRNGNPGQLTITFSAPSSDGGTGITAYYVANGGGYVQGYSGYVFTGLSANTTYTLYVYAVNGAGSGPVASSSNRTYSAPYSLNMTQSYQDWNNFSVSWSANGDGLAITAYRYYFNGNGWTEFGLGTSQNFSGLAAGTTYYIYFQADNAAGTTQAGPYYFATSGSIPPAPTGVYFDYFDNNYDTVGYNLHWNAVSAYPGVTSYYWHFWYNGFSGYRDWSSYTSGTSSGWYYTDTSPNGPIYYNIYAISAAGWGLVAKNY
jgi:titin